MDQLGTVLSPAADTYQLKAAGSPRIQDLLPDNLCGHMFGRVVNLSLRIGTSRKVLSSIGSGITFLSFAIFWRTFICIIEVEILCPPELILPYMRLIYILLRL